jgi:CubicO group peptidase (beta-lactamase class C family)
LRASAARLCDGRAEPVLPVAATPEEVGLSSAQLARIEAVTQRHIETGLVPGAVMLVARRGKIAWTKTMGFRDRAAKDAMRADSIFRIYSMTKPIVSVAAMMLVEEGRMQINDPVAKYLPEIGQMKVGVEASEDGKATLQLTDPAREMTVQDLLRHTSGLIYGSRGKSLVNAAYIEAKIGNRDFSNEEFVSKLFQNCRCDFRPANAGNMASRPTCSAAWPKSFRARRWASSSRSASLRRSA